MNMYSPDFMEFLKVVEHEDCLVCDTETTALEYGEIIQLALCDMERNPVINTYVKPVRTIPTDAIRIHGIENDMVADAPSWATVRTEFIEAIKGHTVIIYNAVYDRKMMHSSDEISGLERISYKEIAPFYCAMTAYAEFHGEWNEYRGSYRWQRLTDAARQQNIMVENAHDAYGDCLMTLGLIYAMSSKARLDPRNPNLDVNSMT